MGLDRESVLRSGAHALQVDLDEGAVKRLLGYVDLLIKWNKIYNLTAIRAPDDILTHHVLDSLAAIEPLRRLIPNPAPRILDVGSGAGLPGAILAIACPQWQITCIDAVQKKTNFLQHAIGALALPNLNARHGRIEEVTERFDLVTARAFASLAQFTTLSRNALAPQGIWCAMKGKYPEDEIAALGAEIHVFHVEHLTVPGLDADRCLVCMRPAGTLARSAALS